MIDVTLNELNITITDLAVKQIKNIIENDYTLEDQVFRLQIDGKGCNGFDYALGFTAPFEEDLILELSGVSIHIDRFTAFYCKEGKIEYLFDLESDQEGFYFENANESKYRGKFFKNPDMEPKLQTISPA